MDGVEPHLHLAQAYSDRAPRGRKHDFKGAERLVRRQIAKERPFQLNDVTVSAPTAVTPAYRLVSHCTQVSSQGLYEPIIPLVSRD